MGSILDRYEEADKSFRMGSVLTDENEKLLEHLSGLANLTNTNSGTQHRDVIRGITINHVLLHRHVETLQKQVVELHDHITILNDGNTKIQRWVIALAVAALIAAVVQTTAAIRSELRAEPVTQSSPPPQQVPAPKVETPTHVAPQVFSQPVKKTP